MTIKNKMLFVVVLVAMTVGTLTATAQQRNRDREAAQTENYGPKFSSEDEQKLFVAIPNTPGADPNAKLAAADAFLAKYPMSQLAGYANRFRMESYVALGKFPEAFAAGEAGLALETKYLDDLIKQADADAANRNRRDRNAPPPIDKNSDAFKTFVADFDKTQMYYYQNIMRSAQESENLPKVLEYGEKALAKSPNDPFSLITVSNVLSRRVPADEKEAEQALKKAEEVSKRAVNVMTQLVNQNAAALSPTQKAAYLGGVNISLGLVYFNQKKYEDAQKSFQTTLSVDPKDAEAYMLLGMSLANQRPPKVAEALDNLAKSVFLKGPTEAQARQSLTTIYQVDKKSLDGLDQFIAAAGAKIPQ
jgi:tetratricopeptide (TPR) repeat protein